MSIKDFTDANGNVVFGSLICSSIVCPSISGVTGSNETLSQVLYAGSNADGYGIQNLASLQLGLTTVSGGGNGGGIAGLLHVTDGTSTGTVYDSHFNPPSNSSNPFSAIAFVCDTPVTINSNVNTAVLWQSVDGANSAGSCPISLGQQQQQLGISSFQNNSSNSVVAHVSGYVSWGSTLNSNTSRGVFARKNNFDTDRYGFSNILIPLVNPCQPFSFDIVLAPNDTMQIYVWHNDLSSTTIHSSTHPGSRIVITTLNLA